MSAATLAALESALARDALDEWLRTIPIAEARQQVRRAVEIDRRLSREHPASLASCLLARLCEDPALAPLCAAWAAELDARGVPWIRPLRGLPQPAALLAELHADAGLSFAGLGCPSFSRDDEVTLTAIRLHPSVQRPEDRRRDRLRWSWRTGETIVEPDPERDAEPAAWPKFEHPWWGPSFLVRGPGEPRIELPCPEEGSAYTTLSADGRLFVYGTHDEYAGGFVYVLDADSLAVRQQIETRRPVYGVFGCSRDDRLLISTSDGLLVWLSGRLLPLPLHGREGRLSPDGAHVATLEDGLRIWSLDALLRGGEPPRPGFRAQFDPSGERLLSADRLHDGRTGATIAAIEPKFGEYLEGGPASPAVHLGARHLINMAGAAQAWDLRSGEPLKLRRLRCYPQWYVLAYDRAGERFAALNRGKHEVVVHAIPDGREVRRLAFELAGEALAMDPEALLIAVQTGGLVELRRLADGALVRRFGEVTAGDPSSRRISDDDTLRFSHDGRRLARFVAGEGWRIWTVAGGDEERVAERDGLAACPDFAAPRPRGWSIVAGTQTLFVHEATGTTIALPAAGPWVCNPADPRIVACDAMHAELRAPP